MSADINSTRQTSSSKSAKMDAQNEGNEKSIGDDIVQDMKNVLQEACCCCVDNGTFLRCLPVFVTIMQTILIGVQGGGAFGSEWIITDNNTIGINLTSSNAADAGFDQTAVATIQKVVFGGLIFVPMVLIISAWILLCIKRHCRKDVNSDSMKRVCFIYFVPIANIVFGIVGFIGCMLVAGSEYNKRSSFYLCLAASLMLILLPIMIVLVFVCCLRKDCLGLHSPDVYSQENISKPVGSEEYSS